MDVRSRRTRRISDGTLPPEVLGRIDACLVKAGAVGDAAMLKRDQTQKLPAAREGQGLVVATVAPSGQFNDEIYCASPSGAFVDGRGRDCRPAGITRARRGAGLPASCVR